MLCSPNCDSHLQVNRYFFLLRLLTFWQTTVVTNMLLIIKTSNENSSCFQRFGEKRFGDKIGLTHVNTSPKLWSWVVSDHGDPGKNRGSPRKAWRLWNELKEEVRRSLNLQPQWRPKCPLCQQHTQGTVLFCSLKYALHSIIFHGELRGFTFYPYENLLHSLQGWYMSFLNW